MAAVRARLGDAPRDLRMSRLPRILPRPHPRGGKAGAGDRGRHGGDTLPPVPRHLDAISCLIAWEMFEVPALHSPPADLLEVALALDATNQQRAPAPRRCVAQMAEIAAELPLRTEHETCPAKLAAEEQRALGYLARHWDAGELIDAAGDVFRPGRQRLANAFRHLAAVHERRAELSGSRKSEPPRRKPPRQFESPGGAGIPQGCRLLLCLGDGIPLERARTPVERTGR